ncbi:uncharacterized protein DNG_06018 [Cephalotrichum gorgonifer]|uniref:Uncharacterized protein n=1 Tax=Cephalotrichum gorgonifer TaxID=2041049 RepID=A0AAE8MYW3_9PEZI|nr:uncharacterized protein DNG_06018 [Cephalotrichum gorgonifer]
MSSDRQSLDCKPPEHAANPQPDLLGRSYLAISQADSTAVPGSMYLVPAGPPIPHLNELTTRTSALAPAKSPKTPLSKARKTLVEAFGASVPDLKVVNKLRRSHKQRARAERLLKDKDKTNTKEYEMLVDMSDPDSRDGTWETYTPPSFQHHPVPVSMPQVSSAGANGNGMEGTRKTYTSIGYRSHPVPTLGIPQPTAAEAYVGGLDGACESYAFPASQSNPDPALHMVNSTEVEGYVHGADGMCRMDRPPSRRTITKSAVLKPLLRAMRALEAADKALTKEYRNMLASASPRAKDDSADTLRVPLRDPVLISSTPVPEACADDTAQGVDDFRRFRTRP